MNLQQRAIELHEKTDMPWEQADELALSEAGIDGNAIRELVSEAGVMVTGFTGVAIMSAEEVFAFARHCLVHAPVAAGIAGDCVTLPKRLVLHAVEHLQSQAEHTPSERNRDSLREAAAEMLSHVSGVMASDGGQPE